MTPQIQPSIRFFKRVVLLCQPFRNTARKTEESIAVCGIDNSIHALGAGAFYHPVGDLIGQLLCLCIKLIVDIPEIRENLQCLQGFDTDF